MSPKHNCPRDATILSWLSVQSMLTAIWNPFSSNSALQNVENYKVLWNTNNLFSLETGKKKTPNMHLNLKPPCPQVLQLCSQNIHFVPLLWKVSSPAPSQKFTECLNWICQSLLGLVCTWRWGGKGQYPEMTSKQCGMWLQTSICSPPDLPWAQSRSCAPVPLENQQGKDKERNKRGVRAAKTVIYI